MKLEVQGLALAMVAFCFAQFVSGYISLDLVDNVFFTAGFVGGLVWPRGRK